MPAPSRRRAPSADRADGTGCSISGRRRSGASVAWRTCGAAIPDDEEDGMKCMAFAAAAALALAGCAGAGSETGGGTAAATPPLVGTQWRLIHFESSDD